MDGIISGRGCIRTVTSLHRHVLVSRLALVYMIHTKHAVLLLGLHARAGVIAFKPALCNMFASLLWGCVAGASGVHPGAQREAEAAAAGRRQAAWQTPNQQTTTARRGPWMGRGAVMYAGATGIYWHRCVQVMVRWQGCCLRGQRMCEELLQGLLRVEGHLPQVGFCKHRARPGCIRECGIGVPVSSVLKWLQPYSARLSGTR